MTSMNRGRANLAGMVVAISISTALDLSISAFRGYRLLRPAWALPTSPADPLRLVLLDAAFLAIPVAATFGLLSLIRRGRGSEPWTLRVPRFSMAVAAAAPLVLHRLLRAPRLPEIMGILVVLFVLGLVLLIESRAATPAMGRGELMATGGFALAVITLAVLVSGTRQPFFSDEAKPREEHPLRVERTPNVLLVSLDTLRGDHLGVYGYARPTMPRLDAFARRATVFERAVAPSSFTLPSHATLFTGLYPESHGAAVAREGVSLSSFGLEDDGTPVLPLASEAITLAEIAREAGLVTGAICANVAYLSPHFGLDQGFETYAVPRGGWSRWEPAGLMLGRKLSERFLPSRLAWWYRSRITAHGRSYLLAEEVTELALRWLEPRRHRPFFLFLNYMDPHAPYLPVRGYRDLFPQADSPQILDRARIESGERAILDRERGPLVDGYDAELRYLDDQLHRLFVRLAEWEQLDHTLVVIVGDHGESFGEHFELEHATGLHEPQLRVPLILRRPGQRSGSRVARPVHLVDVMPTILAETGLEPPPGLQGMSLFEEGPRPYPVTAHLGRYRRDYVESAIYSHPWKLIVSSAGEVELYDLQADPIESVNLAPEHPHLVRELSRELEGFKREVGPRFDPDSRPLDSETLEALRSLGYVD